MSLVEVVFAHRTRSKRQRPNDIPVRFGSEDPFLLDFSSLRRTRSMKRLSSSVRDDGADLQLAQRHRKIVAGSFQGRLSLEPEFATPGVVGKLTLRFTTTGPLTKHSRITCQLPDHGWTLPTTSPNVVLQLPSPNEQAITAALPQVKMNWSPATRTMEFTLLNESAIPVDTPLVLVISGVGTPEKATPQGEAVVTTFEKLVVRSTVPTSTQIIDGPTAFTIPKIVPGSIGGTKRWSPFNCCPGKVSDVTLAFTVNGKVPVGGKLLVELPPDGWDMDGQPKVLLRTPVYHNKVLTASWDCNQHTLEIYLGNDGTSITTKTNVILTVAEVKNPKKETMILSVVSASNEAPASARLTTLSASGGVIDGPSKVDVARISELRERDFEVLTKVLDVDAAESTDDGIAIARIPDLLRRAGLMLSDELYQSFVVPCFPVRDASPSGNSVNNEIPVNSATPPASAVTPITLAGDYLSREELLNAFALVYAPAYKYGQELRVACGRGHVDLVREWISRGCNPNARDASGWSPLHYAADFGQLEVINLLVEMTTPPQENESTGENKPCTLEINARDGHNWTPLMCAAANDHVDVVQRLLALGANVSLTSAEHRSALHWAASRGMTAAVSALLAADADVHQADRCGWTPLHCATLHGNARCAALLVEKGADSSVRDKLEYTPAFFGDAAFFLAPATPICNKGTLR